VTNALRLVFGVPIARELIFVSRFSEEELETGISSDVGYPSPFDKAFAQAFPNERFTLMWLAFESIIHSHSGQADNGKQRERFFKEELKSEIVHEEVFRLFRLRNDEGSR
jgi:hypothetical protein